MTESKKYASIRDLSCAAVNVKPVSFNWPGSGYGDHSDAHHEAASAWDYWSADRCDKCLKVLSGQGESIQHCDVNDCDEDYNQNPCDGWLSLSPPMMSYYYPLDISDPEGTALLLVDSPLCTVTVNGETGLALTGGGMDLSWEICEAFMLLGYLPPLHFADLPGMAGRGTSERDRWIVAGCLKSCSVAGGWAKSKGARLRRMVKEATERASSRKAV